MRTSLPAIVPTRQYNLDHSLFGVCVETAQDKQRLPYEQTSTQIPSVSPRKKLSFNKTQNSEIIFKQDTGTDEICQTGLSSVNLVL